MAGMLDVEQEPAKSLGSLVEIERSRAAVHHKSCLCLCALPTAHTADSIQRHAQCCCLQDQASSADTLPSVHLDYDLCAAEGPQARFPTRLIKPRYHSPEEEIAMGAATYCCCGANLDHSS